MSKGLFFSDLHLHRHKNRSDRLQDCLKVLDWVFDQAVEHDCSDIMFLGDLFHERNKIDVLDYISAFERIMDRMTGDCNSMDFWMLVGNHDMYHRERWDVNSIRPLSAIPNVHIIQSPLSTVIHGVKIDWMPHTENPIKDLEVFKEAGVGDLLCGHMSVHGAQTNTFYGTRSDVIVEYDNEMLPVDVSIFDDWNMTLLGHYHGAQHLNEKVEYIGSPLQLSFGEAFQQKHIVVMDLATMEKQYIVNDFSPKHLIICPQDVQDENYNLDGQFVRIAVDDMGRQDLVDLKRQIAQTYQTLSLDMKETDKKKVEEQDASAIEDIKQVLANIEDMLSRYMEEVPVPEKCDADHMLKVGLLCLEPPPSAE
jgi:DNA repair exonuclease SbcCD nuclease subunit